MDYLSNNRNYNRIPLSPRINDSNKNNSNLNQEKKEILLKSCNNYSALRQSYSNGQLKNISINFGFPNTRKTYKYKNHFPLTRYPIYEQSNIFYYDKNFQLFKNKSVSRYGEKKNKNNASSQLTKNMRLLSPQHKIVTSIKKRKYLDENGEKTNKKNEKDIYELEVVNTILYDGDENNIEKKVFIDDECGKIEQEIHENETNKKNNLLNSVFVEIERDNGEKQLKVLEISKDAKPNKEPCINLRYTIEDKICLSAGYDSEDILSLYDKDTKDTNIKSPNFKTNTNSTYNNISNNKNSQYSFNSFHRGEGRTSKNASNNLLLQESKITNNFFPSRDSNSNIYSSGGTHSTENYGRFSNYNQISAQAKERIGSGTYGTGQTERGNKNDKYFELSSLKKHRGIGIKSPTPRERGEIEINIESGLNNSVNLASKDEVFNREYR